MIFPRIVTSVSLSHPIKAATPISSSSFSLKVSSSIPPHSKKAFLPIFFTVLLMCTLGIDEHLLNAKFPISSAIIDRSLSSDKHPEKALSSIYSATLTSAVSRESHPAKADLSICFNPVKAVLSFAQSLKASLPTRLTFSVPPMVSRDGLSKKACFAMESTDVTPSIFFNFGQKAKASSPIYSTASFRVTVLSSGLCLKVSLSIYFTDGAFTV